MAMQMKPRQAERPTEPILGTYFMRATVDNFPGKDAELFIKIRVMSGAHGVCNSPEAIKRVRAALAEAGFVEE